MNRCTGRCCEKFTLPYTPEELAENARASRAGEEKDRNGRLIGADVEKVADMVVPLGACEESEAHWRYTCRHFDTATRNCRDYGNRPRVCSEFPYGKKCPYEDCEWKDAVKSTAQYLKVSKGESHERREKI